MVRLNTKTTTGSRSSSTTPASIEMRKLIEKRAYEFFQRRGGKDGNDWADWLEAERLVKKQYGIR